MKKLVLVVAVVFAAGAAEIVAQSDKGKGPGETTIRKKLDEVNRGFTYLGKPINPRAIHELITSISDSLPGPVAIDVEGTHGSNRYFGDFTTEGTMVRAVYEIDEEQQGSFAYEHLGLLGNGFHVVRTFDHIGGTGVFQSLLLLKCVADYEYDGEGKRRERLVLMRMGEIDLGDRYSGTIRLRAAKNRIDVGRDERNRKEGFSVRLR